MTSNRAYFELRFKPDVEHADRDLRHKHSVIAWSDLAVPGVIEAEGSRVLVGARLSSLALPHGQPPATVATQSVAIRCVKPPEHATFADGGDGGGGGGGGGGGKLYASREGVDAYLRDNEEALRTRFAMGDPKGLGEQLLAAGQNLCDRPLKYSDKGGVVSVNMFGEKEVAVTFCLFDKQQEQQQQ